MNSLLVFPFQFKSKFHLKEASTVCNTFVSKIQKCYFYVRANDEHVFFMVRKHHTETVING